LTQVVNLADTTTALSSSLNPSTFGAAVTVTAAVTVNAPGAGTPAGSVTFTIDNDTANQPIVTLDASGNATLTLPSLDAGAHTISAAYGATASFHGSSAGLTQNINQAATTTTLTPSQ